MKWILVLFGLLAVTQLVTSKPAQTGSEALDDPEDDEMQNDDYDMDDDEEDLTEDDDEASNPLPEVRGRDLNLRARPGNSVELPCDIANIKYYVLLWKKITPENQELLYQDTIDVSKDTRYVLFKNKTVKIENLNTNDTANYECSVAGHEEYKVTHKLDVDTPPKIVRISPTDKTEILAGKVLELECEASGVPAPKIVWAKSGTRILTNGYEGPTVTFESVQKDNGGVYQCMADNEVDPPATANVEITVIYAPIIKIEKLTVNSAEGYESQLTCIVHGNPKPSVLWKKDNVHLKSDNNINIINEGNRHILKIIRTKKSDFGNYTCMAENKVGEADRHVLLSGKPAPPELINVSVSPNSEEAYVEFKIESNSPISEYQLQYKVKGEHVEWMNVSPKVTNADGNIYTVKHTLTNLNPGEVYDIRMRSKNTYGWSHYSHHKTTQAKSHIEEDTPPLAVSEKKGSQKNTASSSERTLASLFIIVALSIYCTFV